MLGSPRDKAICDLVSPVEDFRRLLKIRNRNVTVAVGNPMYPSLRKSPTERRGSCQSLLLKTVRES